MCHKRISITPLHRISNGQKITGPKRRKSQPPATQESGTPWNYHDQLVPETRRSSIAPTQKDAGTMRNQEITISSPRGLCSSEFWQCLLKKTHLAHHLVICSVEGQTATWVFLVVCSTEGQTATWAFLVVCTLSGTVQPWRNANCVRGPLRTPAFEWQAHAL